MDGENKGRPIFLMDDLGGKPHYFWKHPHVFVGAHREGQFFFLFVGQGFNASIALDERYLALWLCEWWGFADGRCEKSCDVLWLVSFFVSWSLCSSIFIFTKVFATTCMMLTLLDPNFAHRLVLKHQTFRTFILLHPEVLPSISCAQHLNQRFIRGHTSASRCHNMVRSTHSTRSTRTKKVQAIVLVRDDWLIPNSSWMNASFWQGMRSFHLPMATSQGEGFGFGATH